MRIDSYMSPAQAAEWWRRNSYSGNREPSGEREYMRAGRQKCKMHERIVGRESTSCPDGPCLVQDRWYKQAATAMQSPDRA